MKKTRTTWERRISALHRREQQRCGFRHDLANDFRERLARDGEFLGERPHDVQILRLGAGAYRTEPMLLHYPDEKAMGLVDFAVDGIRKRIGLVEFPALGSHRLIHPV